MKQTTVTTIQLKNIHDKDLLYVVIGEGPDKVIINVGSKTWQAVKKLTDEPELHKNGIEVNPKLEKKGGK